MEKDLRIRLAGAEFQVNRQHGGEYQIPTKTRTLHKRNPTKGFQRIDERYEHVRVPNHKTTYTLNLNDFMVNEKRKRKKRRRKKGQLSQSFSSATEGNQSPNRNSRASYRIEDLNQEHFPPKNSRPEKISDICLVGPKSQTVKKESSEIVVVNRFTDLGLAERFISCTESARENILKHIDDKKIYEEYLEEMGLSCFENANFSRKTESLKLFILSKYLKLNNIRPKVGLPEIENTTLFNSCSPPRKSDNRVGDVDNISELYINNPLYKNIRSMFTTHRFVNVGQKETENCTPNHHMKYPIWLNRSYINITAKKLDPSEEKRLQERKEFFRNVLNDLGEDFMTYEDAIQDRQTRFQECLNRYVGLA